MDATASPRRGVASFLYTSNPFYVISAGLVLLGARLSVQPGERIADAWILLGILCGYTLVLAATATFLIRKARLWEDTRSIVLVVVMLLFVHSLIFDQVVLVLPTAGGILLGAGFLFCVIALQLLIGGLGIRFPKAYHWPLLAIFALCYAYPVWLAEIIRTGGRTEGWIAGFTPLAGLTLLLLLPAARAGASLIRDNRTPWPWPYYPWSLFVLLLIGLCVRSYLLSLSFLPESGKETIFDYWFLVPIAAAAIILLQELLPKEGSLEADLVRFLAPMALVPLSLPSDHLSLVQAQFLRTLSEQNCSPAWWTIHALVAIYGYSWYRGHRSGGVGVIMTLLLASLTRTDMIDLRGLAEPQPVYFLAIAAIELAVALRVGGSLPWFGTGASLIVAICLGITPGWFGLFVAANLLLALTLAVGTAFRDDFAIVFRYAGGCLFFLLGGAAIGEYYLGVAKAPGWSVHVYLWWSTTASFVYFAWTRLDVFRRAGQFNFVGLALTTAGNVYQQLQQTFLAPGLFAFSAGAVFFVVALLVSLSKVRRKDLMATEFDASTP